MALIPFFTKAAKMDGAELDRHLVLAAQEGNLKKMKQLIKEGADIDGRDASEDTPLIGAARENQLEALKFLLKEGADRTLSNGLGKTALLVALSDHASDEISLALIAPDAALDAVDMHGNPAAYYAAQYGHPKVLEALAKTGADISKPGKHGTTPIMRAMEVDQVDTVRLLLSEHISPKIGIDSRNDKGATALMVAIENGRVMYAMSLLALGANADIKDHSGRTALSIAEETQEKGLAQMLRENHLRKYAAATGGPVKAMKTISLKTGASA